MSQTSGLFSRICQWIRTRFRTSTHTSSNSCSKLPSRLWRPFLEEYLVEEEELEALRRSPEARSLLEWLRLQRDQRLADMMKGGTSEEIETLAAEARVFEFVAQKLTKGEEDHA